MFVYQITLPKDQDLEAFVTFMREEYLPGVYKGPTRVGEVTDLVLLQSEEKTRAAGHNFILQVGWEGLPIGGGLRINQEEVKSKFDSFKARVKLLGSYYEAAAWHMESPA
jgi:hypothetical protein